MNLAICFSTFIKGYDMNGKEITQLRFYVQKVLPLVYDDSLSYMELLCKVKDKLNEIINSSNGFIPRLDELDHEVEELELRVDRLENGEYDDIIKEYLDRAIKNVFFGLTDSGYFVAYIPDGWNDVKFNTTGYDIALEYEPEYGHLVLSY